MNFARILLLVCVCLNMILSASAQDNELAELTELENHLSELFQFMSDASSDKDKDLINNDITIGFEEALKIPGSFNYAFDSLKYIGKILSSDKRLRIYTWNIPYHDGTHQYVGYLQYIPEKTNEPEIFKLTDKSEEISNTTQAVLDNNNWYGALYYDIILCTDKKNRYYTLLGFDFNDIFSSKKVIDVLYFDEDNKPVFGKPLFEHDGKLTTRIIFEFSARVSMTLKYHKEKEIIVYDHLSPSRPSLTGKYQFYGPDMSYDGLKFEDGIWKVQENIDIRNMVY
jgi:hypothetical protein